MVRVGFLALLVTAPALQSCSTPRVAAVREETKPPTTLFGRLHPHTTLDELPQIIDPSHPPRWHRLLSGGVEGTLGGLTGEVLVDYTDEGEIWRLRLNQQKGTTSCDAVVRAARALADPEFAGIPTQPSRQDAAKTGSVGFVRRCFDWAVAAKDLSLCCVEFGVSDRAMRTLFTLEARPREVSGRPLASIPEPAVRQCTSVPAVE